MKKIGITGSCQSGLGQMNEIFECYGFPVFEADLAIKFLLNWREDVLRQIRIQFGSNVLQNGFVDPNKFKNTDKFDRLLDVIEIDIKLLWEEFLLKHSKSKIVFFKSYIVFERGWHKMFDKTIYVYKPLENRIQLINRVFNLSNNDTRLMTSQELSDKEKLNKSDFVIHNHDNLSLLTQFESIKYQVLDAPTIML
jgi:dephospho-CoA kinase